VCDGMAGSKVTATVHTNIFVADVGTVDGKPGTEVVGWRGFVAEAFDRGVPGVMVVNEEIACFPMETKVFFVSCCVG